MTIEMIPAEVMITERKNGIVTKHHMPSPVQNLPIFRNVFQL